MSHHHPPHDDERSTEHQGKNQQVKNIGRIVNKNSRPPAAKSRNVHRKVALHAESLSGERLREKVRVLQVGRHMLDFKLSPCYTLSDEVVSNVDVLRVRGGTRVVSQPKRPHVVLVHSRRAYTLPESKPPQTTHKCATCIP